MADTAQVVQRVADQFVMRLADAFGAALAAGAVHISEAALARAFEVGSRASATAQALRAEDPGTLRTLVTKQPLTDHLLDVAQASADATRCAVQPTATPAARSTADANRQMVAEATVSSVRAMVGADTVPLTADLQRAIDTTPIRNVATRVPSVVEVEQAVREAARVAAFDATAPKVRRLFIADLRPRGPLVADSELVVRYRTGLPVPPVVVNEEGVILDGKTRAASAWAAGLDRIDAVVVRSDDGAMAMEWLRWNN